MMLSGLDVTVVHSLQVQSVSVNDHLRENCGYNAMTIRLPKRPFARECILTGRIE